MNKIKIPAGWRKLRKGTVIENGDKWNNLDGWMRTFRTGDRIIQSDATYIRRIPHNKAK